MRDIHYLAGFLLLAGALIVLGKDLLESTVLLTWGLAFGGTTAVAVLLVLSYRLRTQLRESRHELTRKEAEMSFALQVQKSLFPRRLPMDSGLEFSAICLPARGIGGDYYDIVALSGRRLAIAVADISGKGISAAILMANLQAMLRIFTGMDPDPREVCSRLNRHLHEVMDESRFATIFYAQWNPDGNRLHYVNAGHNPPFLFNSGSCRRLNEGGFPLGIFPESEYDVGDAVLAPGDILVLYSDGVTEATSPGGEEFGESRLERLISACRGDPVASIRDQILRQVGTWSGKAGEEDDMTLVVARATGLPAEEI